MDFSSGTYLPRDRWRALVDELLRVLRQDPLEQVTDLESAFIWTLAEVAGVLPQTATDIVV